MSTPKDSPSSMSRATNYGSRIAEDCIYAVVSLLLVFGAGVLLVVTAVDLLDAFDGPASEAVRKGLDSLLIVFILVELLSAVRTTITERKLVAEPFLLVGIIASIKEIVVTAIDASEKAGQGAVFRDTILEIAVLGGVVVALAVATLVVRLKEREPEE